MQGAGKPEDNDAIPHVARAGRVPNFLARVVRFSFRRGASSHEEATDLPTEVTYIREAGFCRTEAVTGGDRYFR
jgi:hypothetical protein